MLCSLRDAQTGATLLQILGLPADADSQRVENAYRKKRKAAEKNGDNDLVKEIEQAHSTIFMASLNSRLSVCYHSPLSYTLRQPMVPVRKM